MLKNKAGRLWPPGAIPQGALCEARDKLASPGIAPGQDLVMSAILCSKEQATTFDTRVSLDIADAVDSLLVVNQISLACIDLVTGIAFEVRP